MFKDYVNNYKTFKKVFNSDNNYFESNSIDDNNLFGIKDFYSEDYLNNNYQIKVSTINKCISELEEILLKYKYVLGCLEDIEKNLIAQNQNLDQEFFKLSKISTKGQSFLKMFKLPEHYNHVLDTKIVYQKNISIINDKFVKTKDSLSNINFYLEYIQDNSFFVIFDKSYIIRDIFIDFYSEKTFSIFGVKEDGTMEIIKENVNSNYKFIVNTNGNKYIKLFVTGISDINKFLKDIRVFSYIETNIANQNGFVAYFLNDLNKFTEFIIVSDDETSVYLFDEFTYNNLLNLLATNEPLCLNKYFNNEFLVPKNIKIKNTFKNKMYLVEFFNKNQVQGNEIKIFAKEKKDEN